LEFCDKIDKLHACQDYFLENGTKNKEFLDCCMDHSDDFKYFDQIECRNCFKDFMANSDENEKFDKDEIVQYL
jgi:hypothetical protein